MTLIVDALNRVAREVSLSQPSSWLSATADEYTEIRDDFLLETVSDIADRVDLTSPIGAQTTITGTGVETYSLPSNFLRIQRDEAAVYDVTLQRFGIPVVADGEWTDLISRGAAGADRYYKISGYDGNFEISFYQYPTSDITVSYITTNWMATSGGTAGSSFTDAGDVLLLPRRIVECGIVWRWRERKGLPFDAKYAEYQILLARLANDSRTRRKINFGNKKLVRWQDKVPAFIPAS